jgi:hypothetical protein
MSFDVTLSLPSNCTQENQEMEVMCCAFRQEEASQESEEALAEEEAQDAQAQEEESLIVPMMCASTLFD